MSDWDKFWQDFFTYTGRLSRRRYNRHMQKILLPTLVFVITDYLIDFFELSTRLHDLNHSGCRIVLPVLMIFGNAPL